MDLPRHRIRTAALVAALALTAAALQGCRADPGADPGASAGADQHPGTPSVPTTVDYPSAAEVDPELVTGARSDIRTSFEPKVHVTVPGVPGADALNTALRTQARAWESDFRAAGSGPGAELSIGWTPTGVSAPVIGIALDRYAFAGANGLSSSRTFWYDATEHQVRPSTDLVSSSRDLDAAVRRAVDALGIDVDEEALASVLRHGGPPYLGFTAEGGLLARFDEYQIADGTAGNVAVSLDDVALSPFGTAARFAALHPVPARHSPTEVPRATPTPAVVDCRRARCVALTFDDGPAGHTARLLDVLAREHVRATFFVLGQQVDANPQLARRIAAEGHEIGNHSWSHRDLAALGKADLHQEVTRTTEQIERTTGVRTRLLRPPYGATDAGVDRLATSLGLAEILWDVDPLDWKDRISRVVTQRVLSRARRGSIVLVHDIHRTTVDAAAGIIEGLRDRGFTLVTVSELLGAHLEPGHHYFRGGR